LYRRYDWTLPYHVSLAQQFVPVAVEHRTWQDSIESPDTHFPGFLGRTGLGSYVPEEGHGAFGLVGLFALRPDGTPLMPGLTTAESPKDRLATPDYLLAALEAWKAVPPEERTFDAADPDYPRPRAIWASGADVPTSADGSIILQSWIRDLPRDAAGDAPVDGFEIRRKQFLKDVWNTDFVWIEDPEALVPASPVEGAVYRLPSWIATRLARFHMVDNVGGLTREFPRDTIEAAELLVKILSVTEERVELEISGTTRAVESGHWNLSQTSPGLNTERGFETRIGGRAVWLPKERRFEQLEFLAVGTRWGGTAQNRRWEVEFPPTHNDLAPAPIGIWFELYEGPDDGRLPPFFTWHDRTDNGDYWEP
jgi:hypothetical protein